MKAATDEHMRKLLAILREVEAPMTISELASICGLQTTTVSSTLRDAVYWGKGVRQFTDGPKCETFFEYRAVETRLPAPTSVASDDEEDLEDYPPYCQLVGQFKLLNFLQRRNGG